MEAVLLLVLFVIVIYVYISQKNPTNSFPTPPGHFLLGHMLEFAPLTNILNTCTKFVNEYGSIVNLRAGPVKFLLTNDPKFTGFILNKTKNLTKSENYLFLQPWIGSGLLISEGAEWKRSRKIITPAFHFQILRNFVKVFESVGDVFIEKLKKCDAQSVDLCPLVTLCTLDIICETAMDRKINAQNGENFEYVKSVQEMTQIVVNRSFSVLKLKNWSYFLTADYYRQKKVVKILHNFTNSIIATTETARNSPNSGKLVFLDLLKSYRDEFGNKLSDQKIREEVDTFMFEGHDTTASAICFTLYSLAQNPDIQTKVLTEQKELFGDNKNPQISYQDLQNMNYLENVIKESLRLYPPVSIIGRLTTKDLQYENDIITKDTNILLFIFGLHRNPEVFPDPEKFDPDRFDSLNTGSGYVYLPFSAGERNCIGQKFALLEMKSVISKVVRHFEVRPAVPESKLELSMEIVLKSATGIRVGLKERKY